MHHPPKKTTNHDANNDQIRNEDSMSIEQTLWRDEDKGVSIGKWITILKLKKPLIIRMNVN